MIMVIASVIISRTPSRSSPYAHLNAGDYHRVTQVPGCPPGCFLPCSPVFVRKCLDKETDRTIVPLPGKRLGSFPPAARLRMFQHCEI